jgi:predicted Zn-dependent protease
LALRLLALAGASLLAAACATNPVTGQQDFVLMDERQEVEQGRQQHAEVLKEYPPYRNPKLQKYVSDLGQKLAKQSHRSSLDWSFHVVDSPEVNAFALPGGYIYVTRGILACLDSEAELAGVLGHEIGHVTARHGVRQQAANTAGQVIGTLAGALLDAYVGTRDTFTRVGSGAAGLFTLSYGRDQELEADRLGSEYLARNDYDPQTMVAVVAMLKAQEQFAEESARKEGRNAARAPSWLSTHPSSDQRLEEIRRISQRYQAGGQAFEDGRKRFLEAIEGMTFGDSREQGVVRGRNFFHEPIGFAVTVPPGWKLSNGADKLSASSTDQAASFALLPVPDKYATHEQFLRDELRVRAAPAKVTLNGIAATEVEGIEGGKPYSVVVATLGIETLAMITMARSREVADARRAELRSISRSFRPLTEADRKAARPLALRVRALPAGGFAALARNSPLGADAERQLRLINNAYPDGKPPPGRAVKVIE